MAVNPTNPQEEYSDLVRKLLGEALPDVDSGKLDGLTDLLSKAAASTYGKDYEPAQAVPETSIIAASKGYKIAFESFTERTQSLPGTVQELSERFYRPGVLLRRIDELQKAFPGVDLLAKTVEEFGKYVLRSENEETGEQQFSIIANENSPTGEMPSEGILDLPLLEYFHTQGFNGQSASFTANALSAYTFARQLGLCYRLRNGRNFITLGGAVRLLELRPQLNSDGLLSKIRNVGEEGATKFLSVMNSSEVQEAAAAYRESST